MGLVKENSENNLNNKVINNASNGCLRPVDPERITVPREFITYWRVGAET